jgi:hypothetical protein
VVVLVLDLGRTRWRDAELEIELWEVRRRRKESVFEDEDDLPAASRLFFAAIPPLFERNRIFRRRPGAAIQRELIEQTQHFPSELSRPKTRRSFLAPCD